MHSVNIQKKDTKYVVNHIDGQKFNNNSNNLEFVTSTGNNQHAINSGLRKIYKLSVTQYDLDEIKIKVYESIKEASDATNIADNKISLVCKNKKPTAGGFIWKYTNKCKGNIDEIDLSDEECVRQIDNFPNYYVTTDGKIYSKPYQRFISQKKDGAGYMLLALRNKGIRLDSLVHRLVAEAFLDNPKNKSEVNHKNKNKSDNRVENLEWVTHTENMIHANKR